MNWIETLKKLAEQISEEIKKKELEQKENANGPTEQTKAVQETKAPEPGHDPTEIDDGGLREEIALESETEPKSTISSHVPDKSPDSSNGFFQDIGTKIDDSLEQIFNHDDQSNAMDEEELKEWIRKIGTGENDVNR